MPVVALDIANTTPKQAVYVDLELDSDLARFDDLEAYLRRFEKKLFIIDSGVFLLPSAVAGLVGGASWPCPVY